jgi:pyruvate/2-oxoglutarate dehydrogenase complex dihydrolipoamide acyltransferase (E2) component
MMRVCWSYDERIEDGLYSQITIAGIQERLEHPELLELSTDNLREASG